MYDSRSFTLEDTKRDFVESVTVGAKNYGGIPVMVVTLREEEAVVTVVKNYNGKHSNTILKKLQTEMGIGIVRAGNLLQHAVKRQLIHEKNMRFYMGAKQ